MNKSDYLAMFIIGLCVLVSCFAMVYSAIESKEERKIAAALEQQSQCQR